MRRNPALWLGVPAQTFHAHTLVLDDVFTEAADGTLCFHPALPPTDIEVARPVATIRTRVLRLPRRRGIFAQEEDDDARDRPQLITSALLEFPA